MKALCWRIALITSVLFIFQVGCGQAPPPETPRPLADADGDGFPSPRHGGRDCNDNDPKINQLANETIGNGVDENCNGQKDEVTAKLGHWQLTTPAQPKSTWHIEIRTDSKTGFQYIRCIQFNFQLKSTQSNTILNLTQWQSYLPPESIKIEKIGDATQFTWSYDNDQDTVKTTFSGQVLDTDNDGVGDTLKGKLILRDTDPKVQASTTLDFTGRPVEPLGSDAVTSQFCKRCYGDETCKAGQNQ
ncbi:MAG TPA: hypothetical protein DCE42_24605 [Myxococcales bacterium]|nr:hypothetical protein [Deltaproteobacteria bacterium]MBU51316.1 hypothetical protein [Deltaproteobacteria bacterium]HAA57969.1 hypothetical protein [Myxococcales bacterium]|tara:strand:- start:7119 stop:7853 length:735 start_codon:yes stop_codon:yes gene_type:complete